jgi:hypothetical protein
MKSYHGILLLLAISSGGCDAKTGAPSRDAKEIAANGGMQSAAPPDTASGSRGEFFRPAPDGDPAKIALQAIKDAGHACGSIRTASRAEDGSIATVCTAGQRYRITSLSNGIAYPMNCTEVDKLGISGC